MDNMIDVKDLRKRYGTVSAVDGVTFEVVRGEFFGLLNTKQPSLEDVFVKYTGLDAVQLERMELLRAVKMGGVRG